jgi:hypothetical protein
MEDTLTVDKLAEVLQETNRPLLMQVLRTLGTDRTIALLTETLHCETNGGMLTKDGTRPPYPWGYLLPARQGASDSARTPTPLPLYRPTTRPATAPAPSGTDLGGGPAPT